MRTALILSFYQQHQSLYEINLRILFFLDWCLLHVYFKIIQSFSFPRSCIWIGMWRLIILLSPLISDLKAIARGGSIFGSIPLLLFSLAIAWMNSMSLRYHWALSLGLELSYNVIGSFYFLLIDFIWVEGLLKSTVSS